MSYLTQFISGEQTNQGQIKSIIKGVLSSDEEIELESAIYFPDCGTILIEEEKIIYGYKEGNRLTCCLRGACDTRPFPHNDNEMAYLLPNEIKGNSVRVIDHDKKHKGTSVKLTDTNIQTPGMMRFHSNSFQGWNGYEWVYFNAREGEVGPPGKNLTEILTFRNMGNDDENVGHLYGKPESKNDVPIKTLRSGTFQINPDEEFLPSMEIVEDDYACYLNPVPQPYIPDFSGLDIEKCKSRRDDREYKAFGEKSVWTALEDLRPGVCVRLVTKNGKIGLERYRYYELCGKEGEVFGIALTTANVGEKCVICQKGITTVEFGSSGKASWKVSVGDKGVIDNDGLIYYRKTSGLDFELPRPGFFLESGNFNLGDLILFFLC